MAVRPRRPEPVAELPDSGVRFSTVIAWQITMEALVDSLDEPYRETMRLRCSRTSTTSIAALGHPSAPCVSLAKARDLLWL